MEFIVTVFALVINWILFQKMGRRGWEGIIPIYSMFVLYKELYGSGWMMLLLLVPILNIYWFFKQNIDLAHRFHKSTGFGVGLALLYPIFGAILAFGSDEFDTNGYT